MVCRAYPTLSGSDERQFGGCRKRRRRPFENSQSSEQAKSLALLEDSPFVSGQVYGLRLSRGSNSGQGNNTGLGVNIAYHPTRGFWVVQEDGDGPSVSVLPLTTSVLPKNSGCQIGAISECSCGSTLTVSGEKRTPRLASVLLCLGFASGCRRSELVALDVEDLKFGDDGLEITIRRSKTDQEGLGRKVGIPYGGRPRTCPVRAVRDWIDLSLITEGPLFRPVNRFGTILPSRLTDQSVALIVKRWALEAGFDPMLFAGHSLRSGLATAAAKAGKSERSIMKQTGHRSVSVVRRYIRDAELFDDNAAAGIGL